MTKPDLGTFEIDNRAIKLLICVDEKKLSKTYLCVVFKLKSSMIIEFISLF